MAGVDLLGCAITGRTPSDLCWEVLRRVPRSARIVMLGESTHGTAEFYTLRAEITKLLIQVLTQILEWL